MLWSKNTQCHFSLQNDRSKLRVTNTIRKHLYVRVSTSNLSSRAKQKTLKLLSSLTNILLIPRLVRKQIVYVFLFFPPRPTGFTSISSDFRFRPRAFTSGSGSGDGALALAPLPRPRPTGFSSTWFQKGWWTLVVETEMH